MSTCQILSCCTYFLSFDMIPKCLTLTWPELTRQKHNSTKVTRTFPPQLSGWLHYLCGCPLTLSMLPLLLASHGDYSITSHLLIVIRLSLQQSVSSHCNESSSLQPHAWCYVSKSVCLYVTCTTLIIGKCVMRYSMTFSDKNHPLLVISKNGQDIFTLAESIMTVSGWFVCFYGVF